MKFMIIRKADKDTEAGVMLDGMGLQPSAKGARIRFSGGKPTVVDGPFAEAKELIAGFTLIQVKSREEALEWVKRWPPIDAGGKVELELRQIYEAEDFGAEITPEIRKQEAHLRERAAAMASGKAR